MLFQEENAPKIVAGMKTVSRRRERQNGARPAVPGRIIEARTRLFDPEAVFAFLVVERADHEAEPGEVVGALAANVAVVKGMAQAGQVALLDAEGVREGYPSWQHFMFTYAGMHGVAALGQPCWRVQFRLATVREVMDYGPNTRARLRWLAEAPGLLGPGDDPAVCPWWEARA